MRIITSVFALVALTGSAGAGSDEWQNVTLDGGITMDVPTAVHNYRPDAKDAQHGTLAEFDLSVDEFGQLFCTLSRNDYDAQFTHALAAAKLAGKEREILCSPLDGWTNVDIGESDSRTSNGYSAAHCAAGYTRADDKLPGQVISVLGVAAPDRFYQFTCTLYDKDQSKATAAWTAIWSPDVKHMEESIKLGQ